MKIRYFCKPKKFFFFISRQDLSKWSLLFIKSIQTLAWAHLSTASTATHFIVDLKCWNTTFLHNNEIDFGLE